VRSRLHSGILGTLRAGGGQSFGVGLDAGVSVADALAEIRSDRRVARDDPLDRAPRR